MFRKVISLVCSLAVLMGLLPAVALPSRAAAEADFQVGYARVDVNPYVVEDDPSSGIMALPLRGTGDVWNRLCTGLVDDNGDGAVDGNDGLKATCISVTDGDGKSVLMITIDLAASGMVNRVRPAVVERVNAAIASGELTGLQELTEEQIYYSGTHTHNAPDTEAYVAAGKTGTNNEGVDLSVVNENLGIWLDRTIVDIGDAAILALKDRAAATLTKDQLAVDDATSPVLHDKELAATRHYITEVDGSEFVCGDGFNSVTKADYADPSDYRTARGVDPKQITQADDTMYLVRFDFPQGGKLPVILTGWKGHPSLNNSDSGENCGTRVLSSDYINAYRHGLEYGSDVSFNTANGYITGWTLGTEQKYRVAFFQNSGGNINTKNYEKVTYSGSEGTVTQYGNYWIEGSAKSAEIKGRACSYGMVLSRLAEEAITDGLNETSVRPGKIKTIHSIYYAARKTVGYSALAYKAAVACRAEAEVRTVTYPYKYTDPDTGDAFLIGSRFHASNLVGYWNTTLNAPKTVNTKIELGAFMLGEDLAFVVVPGEPFDFYYRDTTLTGDAKYADSNNLWNDLIDEDGYGKPFVLGYTNGAVGYFPNDEAYIYNQDTTNRVVGSYETHNSRLERGTGEAMIRIYQQMLTGLSTTGDMNRTGPCAHCGENQLWQPYNGQTTLTTGHYYLCSDAYTNQIKISGGQTVCIDLNGHTMRGETRAIYTSDTTRDVLNIMDTSEAQTGSIRGCGATYGAALGFGGGTILISSGDELNLYSGTLTAYDRTAYSVSAGGVLRILGTFNMYGGTVHGGTACSFTGSYLSGSTVKAAEKTGSGGAISLSGTLNMYGGQIRDCGTVDITGTVSTDADGKPVYQEQRQVTEGNGPCLWVLDTGVLNLYGDGSIGHVQFVDNDALTVHGDYTGSVELQFDALTELPDLTDVGDSLDADVSGASITFTHAPGKTAAVRGNDLVVSDLPYSYETCEACGECQWLPITDGELDAFGKYDMPPGHYRLTEDVTTVQKQPNGDGTKPGTYCVDLAGHRFTGESRAFLVHSGGVLNIFDSQGGGTVEGQVSSAAGGGVLYINKGVINLYGGTVRHLTTRGDMILAGGSVRVNGGAFHLYGGTVTGFSVSTYGGAIQVSDNGTTPGSFHAYGGEVTVGSAETEGDCVYIGSGSVTLSGDAKIAEIMFSTLSSDQLTLSADYRGTVALRYPETVTLENGTDIGNCTGNPDLSGVTFPDAVCKKATVDGTDLVLAKADTGHTYTGVVTAPTCTEGGYTTYTCGTCGDVYRAEEVPATGHDYTRVTVDPTCTESGSQTDTCSGCGDVIVETLPAIGHRYEAVITDPGCTEAGYTTYTCGNCGDTYRDNEVPATGHRYETVTVDPTCTESGSRTDTCAGCGDVIVETLPAIGHRYEAAVTDPGCTEAGYTTYTCGNCGDTYRDNEVPATGHRYETVTVDPTCTEAGSKTDTCAACGDVVTEILPAIGHSYEAVVTEPTCTEAGRTTYTCKTCGDSYFEEIPPLGHTLIEGTKTCGVCGLGPCAHCGEDQIWQPLSGQTRLTTGHYYLASDIRSKQIGIGGGQRVCVDLMGHTFTGENRCFYTEDATADVLSIMDSCDTGVLQGCGALYGGGTGFGGATVVISSKDELNLYSGTLTAWEKTNYGVAAGGVLRITGVFNMYGGTVTGGTASSFSGSYLSGGAVKTAEKTGHGGCISLSGTANLYGGRITGGSLNTITGTVTDGAYSQQVGASEGADTCLWVDDTGVLNLYGDASVEHVYFADADGLTVVGSYTGSAELQYSGMAELTDLTDVGDSVEADVTAAAITFTDAPGKTAAVYGTDLVVSDQPYPYGICEACGLSQWIPLADADLDAMGKNGMTPGHYVLAEDCNTAQKQLNQDGTYCFDLAGHTFTGESRAFYVYEGARLNIMDSAGGGTVSGQSKSHMGGGVLYVERGALHLYGGTVRHDPIYSESTLNAGAVRVAGGTFHIHGGTVEGCPVSSYGGAIYVSSMSDSVGSFISTGGSVIAGTAETAGDCVYLAAGATATLSGDGTVDQLCFGSGEGLSVEGVYTGRVSLKYIPAIPLSNGTVIGSASEDADITGATVTFADVICKAVAVEGTDLVVTSAATGHSEETVPGKAATCTETGLTDGVKCSVCGETLTAQEEIPAPGHSFADGFCTVCGEADPEYVKPVMQPTIGLKYPSLSFEDVIVMNVYYTAANLEDVVEMGLITYSYKASPYGVETAEHVIPGYGWSDSDRLYYSTTTGIAPKDLSDTIYFAVYYKLTDGTYGYSSLVGYSPKTYAYNQLKTGSAEMKPLVVAMLNYGAAAQSYFNYKTDALMNADLTDDQKALVEDYRADMIAAVTQASGSKLGEFVNDKQYTKRYPTISFEGAFCINYYFQPTHTVAGDVTMYIWSLEDFNNADVLTRDNATRAVKMILTETGEYLGVVDGIAAKDLDKAAYVTFCYTDGTTDYCGGVLGYTIGLYCKSQASKTGTLAELAKACAVYGYYAKDLFYDKV